MKKPINNEYDSELRWWESLNRFPSNLFRDRETLLLIRAQQKSINQFMRCSWRHYSPALAVVLASSQHLFWYSHRNHRHDEYFSNESVEKGVRTWATKATSLNPTAPAKDEWHFPRYLHNVLIIVFVLVCCFILCNYFWHTLK